MLVSSAPSSLINGVVLLLIVRLSVAHVLAKSVSVCGFISVITGISGVLLILVLLTQVYLVPGRVVGVLTPVLVSVPCIGLLALILVTPVRAIILRSVGIPCVSLVVVSILFHFSHGLVVSFLAKTSLYEGRLSSFSVASLVSLSMLVGLRVLFSCRSILHLPIPRLFAVTPILARIALAVLVLLLVQAEVSVWMLTSRVSSSSLVICLIQIDHTQLV